MQGRKLTRVTPTETTTETAPVPKYVNHPRPVAPVKPSQTVGAWQELRSGAWGLCSMWDREPDSMRKILLPSLMAVMHALRAAALENGGFGKNYGEARDVHRAKYEWITGRKFSRDVTCTAITKGGTRCKNYPIVGEVHCHTTGHATEEERARSWANTERWHKHFELMLTNIGADEVYVTLSDRITRTREM